MGFKAMFNLLLSVVLFLSVGCGIKLGEKNKGEQVAEIKSASCLNDSLAQLKLFIAGDAEDEKLGEALQCVQNVLLSFKENIRGKDKNSYTPEELGNFITKNFIKGDTKLPPGLLPEFTKLKAFLVGGDSKTITREEIDAISSLIARLKPELIRLNPHMKVIVSKWVPTGATDADEKKFMGAKVALLGFLGRISQLLAATGRPYELDDLLALAGEAIKLGKNVDAKVKTVQDANGLLHKFKSIFIGGSSAVIGAEWSPFTHALGEAYFQLLRLKYFKDPLKEDQVAEKWAVYEKVALDISCLIQDLLKEKGADQLLNTEIVELLVEAKKILPSLDLDPALIPQLGRLKTTLLGEGAGGPEGWSPENFKALNDRIPTLFKSVPVILTNIDKIKKLTPEQSAEKWTGYQDIVLEASGLIQKLLKVNNAKQLRNQELGELLNLVKTVKPDLAVNELLISQIARLKIIFLGDHDHALEGWSAGDFAKLDQKIRPLFKGIQVLVQNFKYLKVEKTEALTTIKYEDFSNAEKNIVGVIDQLRGQIEGPYDLISLKELLVNLSQTLLKDSLKLPENFDSVIELAKSVKITLTGKEGSALPVKDLQLLLGVGIRAYANYVEYANYVQGYKMIQHEYGVNFERLLPKVKATVLMELGEKAGGFISTDELTQLIVTAENEKFINLKLQKESLDSFFNGVWSHLLNPPEDRLGVPDPDHPDKKPSVLPGFNVTAFKSLAIELQLWIENLKAITEVFAAKPEYTKQELITIFSQRLSGEKNLLAKVAMSELLKLLSAKGEMNFNEKGFLKILSPTNGTYHVNDLIQSNIARALSRAVIRAYAGNIDNINNLTGVTLDEVMVGFQQLKYVAFDLNLIDPNPIYADNFIPSRFREANLFTADGNGDTTGTFAEIHHIVLHIKSGIARAKYLEKPAMDRCVAKGSKELLAQVEFNEDCLLQVYFDETAAFEDLPEFIKMRGLHTPEEIKDYYLSLLKAAGYLRDEEAPVKTVKLGDANLFPHVVQYVEMLFATHDASRDGFLQKDEALGAFPVFKEILGFLAKKLPLVKLTEQDLPGMLVYLIKTGGPTPIGTMVKFARDWDCSDGDCQKGWDINGRRLELGKIFDFIAKATRPPPPDPNPTDVPPPAATAPASGNP